jgi:hypothetical protein
MLGTCDTIEKTGKFLPSWNAQCHRGIDKVIRE